MENSSKGRGGFCTGANRKRSPRGKNIRSTSWKTKRFGKGSGGSKRNERGRPFAQWFGNANQYTKKGRKKKTPHQKGKNVSGSRARLTREKLPKKLAEKEKKKGKRRAFTNAKHTDHLMAKEDPRGANALERGPLLSPLKEKGQSAWGRKMVKRR